MINNKGYNFASDYWSHNVYQQAKNAISAQDGIPYGKKGDKNWEYIALAEGWANYREWKMCKTYLKYNSITYHKELEPLYDRDPADEKDKIHYRYAGLIKDLNKVIRNDKIYEKCIATCSTINMFKEDLLKKYPNNKNIINTKFKAYEELD